MAIGVVGARPCNRRAATCWRPRAGFAVASEYARGLPGCGDRSAPRHALDRAPHVAIRTGDVAGGRVYPGQQRCTSGSPLKLSYGLNPLFPELAATTRYGYGMPEAGAIRGLLWGEYRALLLEPGAAHVGAGFLLDVRRDRGVAIMTMIGCAVGRAASRRPLIVVRRQRDRPSLPGAGLAFRPGSLRRTGIQRWPEPGLVLG